MALGLDGKKGCQMCHCGVFWPSVGKNGTREGENPLSPLVNLVWIERTPLKNRRCFLCQMEGGIGMAKVIALGVGKALIGRSIRKDFMNR